jgi:hypothetical protein
VRRFGIVLLACSVVISIGVPALADLPLEMVVDGKGEQYKPSGNGTYVAWASSVDRRDTVYVREASSGKPRRVNARGTEGTMGSFIAGTNKLIYQQFTDTRSDLFIFDAASGDRRKAPPAVNEPGWEYWPQASSHFILFMRTVTPFTKHSLMLYNRVSRTTRRLIADVGGKDVFPGYAGSRYAAWTSCGSKTCSIFVFDASDGSTRKLATPDGSADYAPALDEATGDLYFIRSSANDCGRNVSIRKAALGSPDSLEVATLRDGTDTGWNLSLATDPVTSLHDLYFERWVCSTHQGDIYAVRSVDGP